MILKKNLILTLTLILLILSCQGQTKDDVYECNIEFVEIIEEYDYDNINNVWLKEDLVFYKKIRELCRKSPQNIEKLISVKHIKESVLGNGYSVKSGSHGIGYVSLYYDFIYMNDSLISYKLNLPFKDILLLEKNYFKPQEIFVKTDRDFSNLDEYVFYFGFENVNRPYNSIEKRKDISSTMEFYMTPFSGIKYGCRGGYGNSILPNRCSFRRLKYEQKINSKDLMYIMHSINLASRLTAVEYYTENISEFDNEEQKEIEEVIAKMFFEFGDEKIEVLLNDIGYYLTIEDAINKQLKNYCN